MNKCLFSGRFVEDPKILVSKSGTTYTRFILAVNDRMFDVVSDRWVDKATFLPCIAYGEIAKQITSQGKKGLKVSLVAHVAQTTYRKNPASPTKKETIFTVESAEIDAPEEKWHSKQWI